MIKAACDALTFTCYSAAAISLLDDNGKLIASAECGFGDDFGLLPARLIAADLPACFRSALTAKDGIFIIDHHHGTHHHNCPLPPTYREQQALTLRLEYEGKSFGVPFVFLPRNIFGSEDRKDRSNRQREAARRRG